MSTQKYELSDDAQFDAHPDMEFMVEDPMGTYVKFEDVRKLLNDVYDQHRDKGSDEWDAGVSDTIQDLMIGMGIDHMTEMKR